MPDATHINHARDPISDTRRPRARLTRKQVAETAIRARLAVESWDDMTAAANKSDRHPMSLERWRKLAAESNPALSDAQLNRQAERLRRDFYASIARRAHEVRRANRANRAATQAAGVQADAGAPAA